MPKITKIPASISRYTSAPIDAPVKRKVAAYARVSTDSEEQLTSYAAQISYYTEYIKRAAAYFCGRPFILYADRKDCSGQP